MGAGEPLAAPLRLLAESASAIGARAWVVGGHVRDRLLGRSSSEELDIVVEEGRGEELAAEFARRTGSAPPVVFERFGTAQVRWQGTNVEFASCRAESYAADSRKPDVRPAALDEDLRRRDFTVNTLLMDFEGEVHDRLGTGLPDLRAGILRTPLDPLATFRDDPLRMLRAVRFAAQLGFTLDTALMPAMRELHERLRPPVLSVERITDEVRKMLLSPRPRQALEQLEEAGLLVEFLPEVSATRGVAQGGFHLYDVFGHTVRVVEAAPADLVTRLAALLHDIGKPATAAADGSFTGHDKVGAQMAAVALARLRFSNLVSERVARLVRMHLRPVFYDSTWTDGAIRRLARDAGQDLWRLMDLGRADIAASAYDQPEKLDELAERLRAVAVENPDRTMPAIDGADVMEILALPPGPGVGRVKLLLEDLVMEGTLEPDRDAIRLYLREHPDL